MYQKGLASRFALDGLKVPLSAGWFYNAIDPVIKREVTADTFFDQHMHYVHAIAKTLADTPPKRVVRKFITRPSGLKDVDAKRLMQYTRDLHSVTKIETKDGRSFSFGCVQVVNVKSCQKMAIELCAIHADQRIAHPDFDYRVICLHGRLSHASRNYIEQRLNLMLSRGGKDGDLAPLKNPEALRFVKESTAKNLMIILVSTLETTGRDHDFDWGIIEPRDDRSIIQFAGRIRRHRDALQGESVQNISIFNEPLSWKGVPWELNIDKPGVNNPFARYGVGDVIGKSFNITHLKANRTKDASDLTKVYGDLPTFSEMLSVTYGGANVAITPARVLTDAKMHPGEFSGRGNMEYAHTVRACEVARLINTLTSQRPGKAETLMEWSQDSNKAGRLLATHAAKYRFRNSIPMEHYWCKEDSEGIVAWYHDNSQGKPNKQDFDIAPVKFNEEILLFNFSEFDEVRSLMELTGAYGDPGWQSLSGLNVAEQIVDATKYQYHAQVGMYRTHN